ncbi:dihydropyrimidine dehydrogenase [Purpureocillium lavendulum]|uniref:Dihydropyrimidine dehydrogenase n=1 Tax=Purpureocillium lavendulum TaxID=1247861 RepID=A0AB34FN21_9HYPO|nr:dihydropyrimidine dehydrogenase [Purpureocillium lavendulum]
MDLSRPFITAANLTDVEPVAQGLEFHVFKARSATHGRVALRVPQHRVFENVNDPSNDAKELIEQELEIYELLRGGPVPVPQPFELLEVDGYPAMLSEYVDDDESHVPPEEIGRLAALIHTTRLPSDWRVKLVAMDGTDALTAVVERMVRRFEHLAREEPGTRNWIPTRSVLEPVANSLMALPTCLLHMDLRDVNLRVHHGKAVAVLDWTNALVGPAAIDYFRIMELSRPGDAFVEAYAQGAVVPEVTPDQETFLRLDAALMLALVFISEAPDPERRGPSVRRVGELVAQLKALRA